MPPLPGPIVEALLIQGGRISNRGGVKFHGLSILSDVLTLIYHYCKKSTVHYCFSISVLFGQLLIIKNMRMYGVSPCHLFELSVRNLLFTYRYV